MTAAPIVASPVAPHDPRGVDGHVRKDRHREGSLDVLGLANAQRPNGWLVMGLTKLPQLAAGRRRHGQNDKTRDQNGSKLEGRPAGHRAVLPSQGLFDLRMTVPSPAAACTDTALKVRTTVANAATFKMTKAS
ncbi:MAG: hypothetical protein H7236_00255 [Gemmatimonadaceae bacterium]|nr:hypothetical protein [Caulobacter sp.]